MKKIPFSQVKKMILDYELSFIDDMISESSGDEKKEMIEDKKSLKQEMKQVKDIWDLINVLDSRGFNLQGSIDYISSCVFDFKK